MRCEECGAAAPAGVCVGPHPGVDWRRHVERRYLVFESWPPANNVVVERVDGEDGVMTVVRGERVWFIHGDVEWMRRRVAEGSKATSAHSREGMRRAVERIVELAGRYGLEVEIRVPEVVG